MCSDEILLRGGKIPLTGQASYALARVRDDNLLQCGWQFLEPSPSPPFEGEREGPAKREREVSGAANRIPSPPHPGPSLDCVERAEAPVARLRPFADFVVVDRDLCQGHVYSSVEAQPAAVAHRGFPLETEAAGV